MNCSCCRVAAASNKQQVDGSAQLARAQLLAPPDGQQLALVARGQPHELAGGGHAQQPQPQIFPPLFAQPLQ
jgi:hypothetical protein